MSAEREQFASRIGGILMTAGCAIGLGNIWRFPYVAGEHGGAFFVLCYIGCLIFFGLPVMLLELALGRAGKSTYPGAFAKLQNPQGRFKWKIPAYILLSGNFVLLMFYTVVTGWLFFYVLKFITRDPAVWEPDLFGKLLSSPVAQINYMLASVVITVLICVGGVQKMIEKSVKVMMGGLFLLLAALVIYALTLPNAVKGVEFFLKPDFSNFSTADISSTLNSALSQAFFTLSIGIGSITVCGSYMDKKRSLFQEGFWIITLDTVVAISAGLIIFPCCAAFGLSPDAGPRLIFVTLTRVFRNMEYPFLWGGLFFVFLFIAALSTLVAVFENLAAFGIDEFKWTRRKSCFIFFILLAIFSLPCIFGFNLWNKFQPFGAGSNILDLEDFIVSYNLLPLGAVYLIIFCLNKIGWGADNLFAELNTGKGWKFPMWTKNYIRFVIPVVILLIWFAGIREKLF